MRLSRSVALLALVALTTSNEARADEPAPSSADMRRREPYVFVGDPKLGVETSVRTVDSIARIVFRYDEALPALDIDDTHFIGKLVRGVARFARLLFLDEPIAELTSTTVHEVGGHGARARELGLEPTYLFYLPGIYRLLFAPQDEESAGAFTSYLSRQIVEEPREIIGTMGGLEANYVHAWWINARIAKADGWVELSDLLFYGASKSPYFSSFLKAGSTASTRDTTSNDINSYVTSLQELSNGWRAEDRKRIGSRLTAGYLWNLVDPTLLYSFYGTMMTLFKGTRISRMPLPHIGDDTTLFLSPRFALSPFGAEQGLDVFLARDGQLLDVYARVGTSGIASYYGAGARALGFRAASDRLHLGGELDVWRQPELVLDSRGLFERETPYRLGVNAGVFADVRITSVIGITGKLAAKTPGYVMGQPISGGPHGYIGLSLAWP